MWRSDTVRGGVDRRRREAWLLTCTGDLGAPRGGCEPCPRPRSPGLLPRAVSEETGTGSRRAVVQNTQVTLACQVSEG